MGKSKLNNKIKDINPIILKKMEQNQSNMVCISWLEWLGLSKYLNYYRLYTSWLILCSIIGGSLLMSFNEEVSFLDGLFLAASAITSTGLATVSMQKLSLGSFVVLGVLIVLGGSLVLPLAPLLYRRYTYRHIRRNYPQNLKLEDSPVLSEFDLQDRALGVMVSIIISYIAGALLLGYLVLYGALHLTQEEPELVARSFSREGNAGFLAISAFNNAGYTLSSHSVTYLADNPVAYLTVAVLIIAGNTMTPVFYRIIITSELYYRKHLCLSRRTKELNFILDNPRKVSVNTLPTREVIFLFITTTALNVVQYIFYLASCLDREETRDEYGGQTTLAGLGFFQTVSTRNAGLQIMDLRTMNQGMLLVYAIAMYLSGAPFVTALYASEDSSEIMAKTSTEESGDLTTVTSVGSLFDDEDTGTAADDEKELCDNVTPIFRGSLPKHSFSSNSQLKGEQDGVGIVLTTATTYSTASAESAATIVGMQSEALPGLKTPLSTKLTLFEPATENESRVLWEPHAMSKPRPFGVGGHPGRRPSALGLHDHQVACAVESAPASSSDFPRKSSFNSMDNGGTGSRRSSLTVTFERDRSDSEDKERDKAKAGVRVGGGERRREEEAAAEEKKEEPVPGPSTKGELDTAVESSKLVKSLTRIRRSSLTHLVDTMNLIAPPPQSTSLVHPALHLQRASIGEIDFHKLIRHNSVLLLNQKKFEIQNRFVETFIMKHSFFIGLGVFICAFSEDGLMAAHPDMVNTWFIIFEVISAYGNVGLSLSAPGQEYSLCGNFGTVGKLAIILVMLLGKHRGLPKKNDAVIDFKFRRLKRGLASAKAQLADQERLRMLEDGDRALDREGRGREDASNLE